jgi:hypothetical protein
LPATLYHVDASELSAVHQYPYFQQLIEAIERVAVDGGGSGPGPPQAITEVWLVVLATAIGNVCNEYPVKRFTVAQLWFLALAYLEIRGTKMHWYELSDDDVAYLTWFLGGLPEHHEDDALPLREHVLIRLRDGDMRASHCFFPLLSDTT